MSKRLGSTYRSGRSKHWLKVKNPKAPAAKREPEQDWIPLTPQQPTLQSRRSYYAERNPSHF